MKPFTLWFRFVKFSRFAIVVFWLAAIGAGVWQAGTLFDNLEDDMTPKASSPSAQADAAFYGNNFCSAGFTVVMASSLVDGVDIREDESTQALFEGILRYFPDSSAQTFWTLNSSDAYLAAPMLVSEDNSSTILAYPAWADYVVDGLPYYLEHFATYDRTKLKVFATSASALDNADSDAASGDLGKMDSISIGIATVVLGWRVASAPLMLIPLFILPASLLSAVAILGATSSHTAYPSFSPALFISVSLALCYDWSLFQLARFKSGLKRGLSNDDAVLSMVVHSGHVVLFSGLSLIIAYSALIAFPVAFLSNVGKGAAITLACCIAANISLTPALLLICPCFFGLETSVACITRCMCCRSRASQANGSLPPASPLLGATPSPSATKSDEPEVLDPVELEEVKRTCWYKIACLVERRPLLVLIAVLVLGSPLTYFSSQFKYTTNQNQQHPWSYPVVKNWREFEAAFPAGLSFPYALIAVPDGNGGGLPPAERGAILVQQHNALIEDLIKETGIPAHLFSGPTWVNGKPLDIVTALNYLKNTSSPLYYTPEAALSRYRNWDCPHLNDVAFYTEIDTPFDPQGPKATAFIRTVRKVILKHNDPNYSKFLLGLGLTEMTDVVDDVYSMFDIVMLATAAAMVVLMFLSFRSISWSLMLIVSVVVTLSWSFGAAAIVFQTPVFKSLNENLDSIDAIFWMAPIFCFSLISGLSCDYACFLNGRIIELRRAGYTTADSIKLGFGLTGGVITTAGAIMFVAFASLMISSQMLLVQCGFLISFSVLLDTFVVRCLLAPSMMQLAREFNWFPAKVPTPTLHIDGGDHGYAHMSDDGPRSPSMSLPKVYDY